MSTETDASRMKLRVQNGERTEEYALGVEPIAIGRGPDNNLVVRDGRASRNHCRIEPDGEGGWRVNDLGSQNGTFLNGRKVRRHALSLGDVVQVGASRITLVPKEEGESFDDAVTLGELRISDHMPIGAEPESLQLETLLHLQRTAAAMNSELNLEKLLNLIIDKAIVLTGAERGFLILVGRDEMEFRVARNFERKAISAPEFAISWSIATQVSTSGEAVLCVNAAEDDRFGAEESVLSLGLRSVMCVPFKVKRRVLGVLYLDNRLHKGAFSRTDFGILQMLADQAAVSLENARLYREVIDQKTALEDMNRRLHLEVEEQGSRLRAAAAERGAPASIDEILIGDSTPIRDLKALIEKVAGSDLPVLISGPSGVGKEVVARCIHLASPRSRRPMVAENCCAIPESLLESELFGYEKGAFTGAAAARRGLLETANGSTLFLDEIGDMSLALQTKLLRVLQEREVRRIGGDKPAEIDIRLITATNRDLAQLIEKGHFREDLFYRIKVVSIDVPALRDRREDVPLLVDHFLERFARETRTPRKRLTPAALEMLKAYGWPGNVRELENELRSMASFGGEEIGRDDVPSHIRDEVEMLVGEESNFHDLNELVESIETREIEKALRRAKGNKTKAAKLLGISRFALQRKLDKYDIDPERS
ncbi:MAG: sigma 54-interacting transcriptional regulator [Planctomycetota bacterium]